MNDNSIRSPRQPHLPTTGHKPESALHSNSVLVVKFATGPLTNGSRLPELSKGDNSDAYNFGVEYDTGSLGTGSHIRGSH